MATITENLVWTSTVSNASNLVTNESNTTTSDNNYATLQNSHDWIFELTNLTYTPTSIAHITPIVEKKGSSAAATNLTYHNILNGSNTAYYSNEALNLNSDSDNTTTLTQRTTSNGSDAWTESQINSLRIQLDFLATFGGSPGLIDHYYVAVQYDYDPPAATPGGIIRLTDGKIKLTTGKIILTEESA